MRKYLTSIDPFRPESGWLRYLLLAAAIVTYLLIAVGIVVRVSGSSNACPDWPTCYGQWTMPAGIAAQIQYVHRALAFLSGVLILLSALVAWSLERKWDVLRIALAGSVLLLVGEALLGRYEVLSGTPGVVNAIHLALALLVLTLVLTATMAAFYRTGFFRVRSPFGRWSLVGFGAIFAVLVSGIFLSAHGAAPLCSGWPFCGGRFSLAGAGWFELLHGALTLFASGVAAGLLISAWHRQRTQRVILTAATGTAILFFGQVLIGALKVARGFPLDLVGLHAATAAALWGVATVLVAAVGFANRSVEDEEQEAAQPLVFRERLHDLFVLTKPVIVLLLLVTTYAGMVVGGRSLPALGLTFWTMLGGALAAGGSSAINQYIDRDLDRHMQRTSKRPLSARRMTPAEGLAFGLALCLMAFFLMAGFVNLLAALLSLAGMIYYVLLYSILLKKATVQNIVIGGGAGAIPPMVGWAAATGHLAIPSLFLFAIVFLWTPPHFWALAIVRQKDYARAGVPMLPVVKGEQATRVQIFVYTVELVGLTLLMPLLRMAGSLFLVSALVFGGAMILTAWRGLKKGGNKTAYQMYRYSSMYLALIFVALVLDVFI